MPTMLTNPTTIPAPVRSPPPTPPKPCWGPDRTAQQYSATTAQSWFDFLLNPAAGGRRGRDPNPDPPTPPPEPLVLLSRVTCPEDWTPALLAAIQDLVENYEANDHMAAWATYNILLEKALITRNTALVRMCLQEHRWNLCMRSSATSLVLGTRDACREILPLMVADPRFVPSFIPWLVRTAVDEYSGKGAGVVAAVLQTPQVDPWIVWQQALDASVKDLVDVPKVWQLGGNGLLEPEWAWRRGCAAVAEPSVSMPVSNGASRSSPAGAGADPCPRLLTELPEDIQYKLHTLLDAASVGRVRSACRSLTLFPMTRFGPRRLHFECLLSATESGYHFNSSHFRSLLSAALGGHSNSSNTAAAELIGRVLVESARHLTDPDFSLDLLTKLEQHTSHSSVVTVYVTWSLHTLLTCSPPAAHTNPATSTFLARILTHRSLPLSAWSFVIHMHPTARSILSHATSTLPATVDQDGFTSMPLLLLYLARTRTLPVHFQPTHPAITCRAFRAPDAFSFEPMPPSTSTQLVLSLAVLSDVDTVSQLLKDTPADATNVALKQLALTLAVAKCPPAFVRSLLVLLQPPMYVVRAVLVGLVGKIAAVAHTAGRDQRQVTDALLAFVQDPSEIRSLLVQVRGGPSSRWARARAMWWWLGIVGEEEPDRSEEVTRWVEAFFDEVGKDGKGEDEDEWVGELRHRWEELTGSKKRGGKKHAKEIVERGQGKKAEDCTVQ